ncbi:binding-protein-dependent transport system inner membrane protein [Mycolicibacterium phlei]|uniref:ABC transporter permease n=1 Tax=Mycobacteroides chelonae TaxID=1774 RepID=UPI000618A150|nr:ABC transporter permease [Mycobacteroides chelonae]AKC39203.1 ABC transporter permease [Mycobacteroides chelonae]OLT72402.1 ABC transporter permease [Mycobacteroides chelonae]ORV11725.1 ABC transporter permease [Mycobacteroides chelonae]VEG17194.1 binding-protein-dependent transport system inner membrane protein [Mycolicibacterium phlei]
MSHSLLIRPVSESDEDILARARHNKRRSQIRVWGLRTLLVVVWLASWELAATLWLDPFFYSKPSLIWGRLIEWFTVGTQFGSIWLQIFTTVQEAVLGFLIGTVAGVTLGVLLGRSRYWSEVLAPFIKALNAVPRIVLASLFIIWFGLGLSSKVATVVVLVFFAVFFNAFTGAREVDGNVINNARILGASPTRILTSIVLPSATSWILSSLHTAFGFALIGAVVGEYAGASKGLGLLISNAQGTFDSAGIYAGMIIITVVALLAEWLIGIAESRLLKWRPTQSSSGHGV